MHVGLCVVEIHLSGSHSLKEKRRVLRRLKDRLRNRLNVAVAEIDHQDLWQRSTFGIVSISDSRSPLETCLQQVRRIFEEEVPGHILEFEVEYLT